MFPGDENNTGFNFGLCCISKNSPYIVTNCCLQTKLKRFIYLFLKCGNVLASPKFLMDGFQLKINLLSLYASKNI